MREPPPYIIRRPAIGGARYTVISVFAVDAYECGLHAGDEIRLTQDLTVQDHLGRPTGEVHPAGEVWEVLKGSESDPGTVWLRQPNGDPHSWSDDQSIWTTFEKAGPQPQPAARPVKPKQCL